MIHVSCSFTSHEEGPDGPVYVAEFYSIMRYVKANITIQSPRELPYVAGFDYYMKLSDFEDVL